MDLSDSYRERSLLLSPIRTTFFGVYRVTPKKSLGANHAAL